jgi:hypothetical protein
MPYPLTSADRRDAAALQKLRAAVFEKREALGFDPPPSLDDRAAVDSTLLRGILALTLRHPIRIITGQPATQFEDFEEFFSHLSEAYPEEITELRTFGPVRGAGGSTAMTTTSTTQR